MTYVFNTTALLTDERIANSTGKKLSNAVTCLSKSAESKYPGSVTYLVGNLVYRAFVNPDTNNIQIVPLLSFDMTDFPSTATVIDVVVADNYTVVRLDNDNFYAYIKPKY